MDEKNSSNSIYFLIKINNYSKFKVLYQIHTQKKIAYRDIRHDKMLPTQNYTYYIYNN